MNDSGTQTGEGPVRHLYLGGPRRSPFSGGTDWVGMLACEMEGRTERDRLDLRSIASVHLGDAGWDDAGPSLAEAIRERLLAGHLPRNEFAVEVGEPQVQDLRRWRSDGVTRVNVRGVPRAESVLAGIDSIGFRSWGVDVAFGGGSESRGRSRRELERAIGFGVPHVSLVEREGPADPDRVATEYLLFTDLLCESGYDPWEVTCFARAGHIPEHASAVHGGAAYIGLGPGAHSRVGAMRRRNLLDLNEYVSAVDQGRDPLGHVEELNADERRMEYLMSALRLSGGIPRSALPPGIRSLRERWETRGMAVPDPSRLRLAPRGWLLLDDLVVELALELERLDSG